MSDDINHIVNNIPRLEWACRRGMLELDVLLGNFLAEAYSALSLDDKKLFVRLLAEADPDLFAWIMGHAIPTNPEFLTITEAIRRHAQSRLQS
jgi:antitoxin CptB